MPIPDKREDLIAMGYHYENDSTCRGCGQPIEWWTTPRKKKMPMTVKAVQPDGLFETSERFVRVPHFGECPALAQFRK